MGDLVQWVFIAGLTLALINQLILNGKLVRALNQQSDSITAINATLTVILTGDEDGDARNN